MTRRASGPEHAAPALRRPSADGGRAPIDFHPRQEEDRVHHRALVRVGLASILIGAVGVFLGGVVVGATEGTLAPNFAGPAGTRRAPDQISHVEQTPSIIAQHGEDVARRQRIELERWGWVDRQHGIAQIPIGQAMVLLARPRP